jgi:hypothetical protein
MLIGADLEPKAADRAQLASAELLCRLSTAADPRGGYPVSVGSLAFSHPAMPSGITKTLA